MRYVCDPYEDPDCGCLEAQPEFDEDAEYERQMDEEAGFNGPETTIDQLFDEAVEAADIDG